MAEFFDISGWNPQPFVNTGGTRAKSLIQGPDQKFYFFKNSYRSKGGTDYKYEFWSEIIAYNLGSQLGLNILKYDVATNGRLIGCLSKSMIELDKEQLLEGGKYLTAMGNTFRPEEKDNKKRYTFQLVEAAFAYYQFQEFFPEFLKMLVFDAIIGNSDRHQDNWAFIAEIDTVSNEIVKTNLEIKNRRSKKYISKINRYYYEKVKGLFGIKSPQEFEKEQDKLFVYGQPEHRRFSPIYDSGSSLGRELDEPKIIRMLKDKVEFESFAIRGKSEIHWQGVKLRHFELIFNLMKEPDVKEILKKVILQFCTKFNLAEFQKSLMAVDSKLPDEFLPYALPESRKELIWKVVNLRIEMLKKYLDLG